MRLWSMEFEVSFPEIDITYITLSKKILLCTTFMNFIKMTSTKRSLYVNYPPKPIKILTIRLVRTCEMAQKAFLRICIFQSLLGFFYFWRKKWNKKAPKDIFKSYTNWKILWCIVSHVKMNFFSLRGKAFEE